MPDVLRTATLKIRTPRIVIGNRWTDPGDTAQKHSLKVFVEQIEIDANGYRKGATVELSNIEVNPEDPAVATRTVNFTDPVTSQSLTVSTAGIATAIEVWIAQLLNEAYPA
jgi:hypothetical protein